MTTTMPDWLYVLSRWTIFIIWGMGLIVTALLVWLALNWAAGRAVDIGFTRWRQVRILGYVQAAPQPAPQQGDAQVLISRFERQAHRMGELWERCQGKGWPEKESSEFHRLRDELVPASRAALAAQLQQAAHTGINGTSEAARQKGGA